MAKVYCLTDRKPEGLIVKAEVTGRAPAYYPDHCAIRDEDGNNLLMAKADIYDTREEAEAALKKYRKEHGITTPEEE